MSTPDARCHHPRVTCTLELIFPQSSDTLEALRRTPQRIGNPNRLRALLTCIPPLLNPSDFHSPPRPLGLARGWRDRMLMRWNLPPLSIPTHNSSHLIPHAHSRMPTCDFGHLGKARNKWRRPRHMTEIVVGILATMAH